MRRDLRACLVPLLMLTTFGCTAPSNVSKIMDPESFPAVHYGLYELKSDRLILTHELKADETFGFEYTGERPTALTIEPRTKQPDGRTSVVWRIPLKPTHYQWRPLATPDATVPAAAVLAQ